MAIMARDVAAERAEMLGSIEGKTLLTLLADMAERLGDQPAFKWKEGNAWRSLSWREYRETVFDAAAGLRALGFKPGDFALIMSRNRPEAVLADLATLHARGVAVHLYNTLPPEQVEYIANHSQATFALLEDRSFLAKFDAVRERLPYLRHTILFDIAGAAGAATSWGELLAAGRDERKRHPGWAEAAVREVRPDDLATVLYTSGTTGPPKGVMDTHTAILYMAEASQRFGYYSTDTRSISYLPLAHATGRALDVWGPLKVGGTVHFCPDPLQLIQYALEVHPTVLLGVPRVFEKVHAALSAGIAAIPDPQMKAAVEGAVEVGRQVVQARERGEDVPVAWLEAYDRAAPVRRSLLSKVGLEECRMAATGAAPIDPAIMEFFQALGIPMSEAWGMTELTCAATASELGRVRNGKVGYAYPGMELKLGGDGEVLMRGPLVMKGYYRDEQKTAETIDADGWLHTGDVGEIDADGYLKIVDRKKELIITSGGKNVSPANIEYLLKQHDLIGQALAVGDRRNYITALLVLDPMTAPMWARQHGIETSSLVALSTHPEVRAEAQRAVDAANEHLARVEQVKRFVLLADQWTPETGELTPTMKLKRRVILERNNIAIEEMYRA